MKRGARGRRGGRIASDTRSRGLARVADAKKALDVLCRQVVFARDRHACQKCGRSMGLQWAHIKSRRYLSTRWRLENSLALCGGCHLWWHHDPMDASGWFWQRFPDRANILKLAPLRGQKIDVTLTRIYLEQQLDRYTIGGAA